MCVFPKRVIISVRPSLLLAWIILTFETSDAWRGKEGLKKNFPRFSCQLRPFLRENGEDTFFLDSFR